MELTKDFIIKILIRLFEEKNSRKATAEEISTIQQTTEESFGSSDDTTSFHGDEICQLLQEEIDEAAHAIRMVIVCYVESINERSFYKIKQNIALIKEFHPKVLKYSQTELFSKIVKYAREDMFTGDLCILGDQTQYLNLFEEYTKDPKALSLSRIKDNKPELVAYLGGPQAFDL